MTLEVGRIMEHEIEMRVLPTFFDNECKIAFCFRFIKDKIHIGEVIIHTCVEKLKKKKPLTIAYCNEIRILEEYKTISLRKLTDFLNIIGIQRICLTKIKLT
jgi:hypothetical protein